MELGTTGATRQRSEMAELIRLVNHCNILVDRVLYVSLCTMIMLWSWSSIQHCSPKFSGWWIVLNYNDDKDVFCPGNDEANQKTCKNLLDLIDQSYGIWLMIAYDRWSLGPIVRKKKKWSVLFHSSVYPTCIYIYIYMYICKYIYTYFYSFVYLFIYLLFHFFICLYHLFSSTVMTRAGFFGPNREVLSAIAVEGLILRVGSRWWDGSRCGYVAPDPQMLRPLNRRCFIAYQSIIWQGRQKPFDS